VTRAVKGVVLIVLLPAIVVCLRALSQGRGGVWVRLLTLALGLTAWFVSQSLIAARGMRDAGAIGDAVHDWTAPWHDWLAEHPRGANALLVASSAGIDALGVFLFGSALLGPTLRPGIGLLILFVFRQLAQLTTALPTPPGMIWRRPGVPSLLVTYDVANDFFFSGHTAIAVLAAIEASRAAPWWLALLIACVAAAEALTVLVLRAHYTLDVLTGVFAAYCAAVLASLVCVGF